MEYLEFNDEKIVRFNTKMMQICINMIDNNDQRLLSQTNVSIQDLCSDFHAYYKEISESEVSKSQLFLDKKMLADASKIIAGYVTKDFDAIFEKDVEKTRMITVEVPKVRKVGLFKKENYIDHETKTKTFIEREEVIYKGWRIERLCRQEGSGDYSSICFFDYFLGLDGKLYLVVSNSKDLTKQIYDCILDTPALYINSFCNIFTSVMGGVTGALDAIPIDKEDPRRKVSMSLDDDYYYNFPIQINDHHEYPYRFGGGVVKRLINLLTQEEKEACLKAYSWIEKIE